MAAPPDKTVDLSSLDQTAAIRQLEDEVARLKRDVAALEQAVLMIVGGLAPLGTLSDAIGYEAGPPEEDGG